MISFFDTLPACLSARTDSNEALMQLMRRLELVRLHAARHKLLNAGAALRRRISVTYTLAAEAYDT
jgi:hypothetical protein